MVENNPVVEPAPTSPFTILVVCTGNICRSPLAAQLLAARLSALGISAVVQSAGTRALVDSAMTPEAASLSLRYGGNPAHAARQLTESLVDSADLILTATREHRSETVTLLPRASRRTFTLNQLARLVTALPLVERAESPHADLSTEASLHPALLRAYIAEIAASRGATPPPTNPADDDITDPYRHAQDVYDEVGRIIDDAVTTISAGFARTIGQV